VDALHPVSKAAATYLGTAVDMSYFGRIMYILDVGVFGSSATVDFQIQGSPTSGGTYAALTGKSITQMLAAGGNNLICKVGATAEDFGTATTAARWSKYQLIVGTAATLVNVIGLASVGRYKPEDGASVGKEIAAVTQTIFDTN